MTQQILSFLPSSYTPLRHLGPTRRPPLSSPTTPLGASGPKHSLCYGPPLRPRGRIGVFRRREASTSLPVPGHLLLARLAVPSTLLRGVTSCRGAPPADPFSAGSALPFFVGFYFVVQFACPRGVPVPGQAERVFPACVLVRLLPSCSIRPRPCVRVPRCRCVLGRPDVFPRRDCVCQGHPCPCVHAGRGSCRL